MKDNSNNNGFTDRTLEEFFGPARNMEIDFLITTSRITSRKNISPIEVKSGSRYTLTSLKKCMAKFDQQVGEAFVVHTNDVEQKDGITFLPFYMAGLL